MSISENVLITGASSVLITELLKKIDTNKFRIIAVTRNKSKINNTAIKVVEGDICNRQFVDEIISENKVDTIIHAAAVTHTLNAQEYFDVNWDSTINLVKAAKQFNVKRFVYISSRTAGEESGAYGLSKLKAEEYIQANFYNHLIIRPSEIFGGSKNEGIDKLIHDIFHKKIIVCPVNLQSKLYPIYNADAIQIIYDLIFGKTESTDKLVIFNGSEGFTYYELTKKISKLINKKVIIIPIPKFVMYLIKGVVEVMKFKIGFVPDQVPRLYSPKETGKVNYKTMSIEEYIVTNKAALTI